MIESFEARDEHKLQTTESREVAEYFSDILKYFELSLSTLVMLSQQGHYFLLVEKVKMMRHSPDRVGEINHQKRPPTERDIGITAEVDYELGTCVLNGLREDQQRD